MSFINLKKGKKTSVICGHFTAFLILFSMSVWDLRYRHGKS